MPDGDSGEAGLHCGETVAAYCSRPSDDSSAIAGMPDCDAWSSELARCGPSNPGQVTTGCGGFDILSQAGPAGESNLARYYDATTGELVAWVSERFNTTTGMTETGCGVGPATFIVPDCSGVATVPCPDGAPDAGRSTDSGSTDVASSDSSSSEAQSDL